MYHRFTPWTLAGLKILTIGFALAEELDHMNQDWLADYPHIEDTDQWSESPGAPNLGNQGDVVQSDLFGSTSNTLLGSGPTGPEDYDIFEMVDPNALIPDFDNTVAVADTDSFTSACASDGSPPTSLLSKGKKSKKVCPATTLDIPSIPFLKQPECKLEPMICPATKTAMCCSGGREGWFKYSGFSVGGCIKCRHFFFSFLPLRIQVFNI